MPRPARPTSGNSSKWSKENPPPKRHSRPIHALSEQERTLAHGVLGGLSHRAALRKAGYADSASAAEILGRPRMLAYLNEMRFRQVERLDYTIENLCARLEHIAFCALADGQYAPAVSAVCAIAKMMGHMADKHEIEMHFISKPAREPTKETVMTPEAWQRQFAPQITLSKSAGDYDVADSTSPNGSSKARSSH